MKLLAIIALLFVAGCSVEVRHNNFAYGIVVTTIDSCEYITWQDGFRTNSSHKGNCKFCLERTKK